MPSLTEIAENTKKELATIWEEIKRLNQVVKYEEAMNKAKTEKKKSYYREGMKMLLRQPNETLDNFHSIMAEYENAYNIRKTNIDNLYNEIKIIKKLKV